jgi:hypothetical protein
VTDAPRADRPAVPAGYLEARRLPWDWARRRLERARNYWIATVTPAGRPHCRPYWAVWLDGALYFSSGSRIRRHLEASPEVSVHLESGDETVILEGVAAEVRDGALLRRVATAYNAKYGWDVEPEPGEFLGIRPRVGFGWMCDGSGEDRGALYAATATRWTFPA